MKKMTELIHEYFDTYGWQYEYDEKMNTWHTGFRGQACNFNIFVHLTENWIIFSISPFVNAPEDDRCRVNLHAYLLKLNYLINMAKFSLDEEDDLVLTVELPTENFQYSDFEDGLNALSYYGDTYYREILNVAMDPDHEPVSAEEWIPGVTNSGNHDVN